MSAPLAVLTLLMLAGGALLGAGCGSGEDAPSGAKTLAVKLTDAGCEPHSAKLAAGPGHFQVENDGTVGVSEFEVLDGDTILGEKENISEGLRAASRSPSSRATYTTVLPRRREQERGHADRHRRRQGRGRPRADQGGRRLPRLRRAQRR